MVSMNKAMLILLALMVLLSLSTAFAQPDLIVETLLSNATNESITIPINVTNRGNETAEQVNVSVQDYYMGREQITAYILPLLGVNQSVLLNYEVREAGEHDLFILANITNEKDMLDNWALAFATKLSGGIDMEASLLGAEKYIEGEMVGINVFITNVGKYNVSGIKANLIVLRNGIVAEIWNATINLTSPYEGNSIYIRPVPWVPPSGGEYILKLEVIAGGDVDLGNNIAMLNVNVIGLMDVNFSVKDSKGNVLQKLVSIGKYHGWEERGKRIFSVPNQTAQTITVESLVSDVAGLRYESVKFLNSNPKHDMSLVFEEVWQKLERDKYFYHIYMFRPVDWSYSGVEVEFESYPNVTNLSVYGCTQWDWVAKGCKTEWAEMEVRTGSIIGNTESVVEAVGMAGPAQPLCGNSVCDSGVGESHANCPQDCIPLSLVPLNIEGGGAGGAPAGGGGGVPAAIQGIVKNIVGGVEIARKNETLTGCLSDGERNCLDGNLNVCTNNKIVMYECFYGCDEAEKKCIEVQPPARFYSENPAMDAEIIIFITVTGILAAGAVLMFLQWESLRKNAKRIRKKK